MIGIDPLFASHISICGLERLVATSDCPISGTTPALQKHSTGPQTYGRTVASVQCTCAGVCHGPMWTHDHPGLPDRPTMPPGPQKLYISNYSTDPE